MMDFELYVKRGGVFAPLSTYPDREGFVRSVRRIVALRAAKGREADDALRVLCVVAADVAVVEDLGLLVRALRQYNEIGFCEEMAEVVQDAWDNGAEAVGWGADPVTLVGIAPYDMTGWEI